MSDLDFGIYVHIPFCRQLCTYCDFTKYELGKVIAPDEYVSLVAEEIRLRSANVLLREYSSLYFGGGTPSLLKPALILSIIDALAKQGFRARQNAELTIEIDPATLDESQLDEYLKIGFNRFSVGAQTFNERHLQRVGRKHSAQDIVDLLRILERRKLNYSFDLLFALPQQTRDELQRDLDQALEFSPAHISAYCLTVPEGHKLAVQRPSDEQQAEMFEQIETALRAQGLLKYEISNFAKPGFESHHNQLYWRDQPYWGLGMSSHSYFPAATDSRMREFAPWGARFWNRRGAKEYREHLQSNQNDLFAHWPPAQIERLSAAEALTDFCHTSLRMMRGLDVGTMRLKFGNQRASLAVARLQALVESEHLATTALGFRLTPKGEVVANLVFEKLTFLAGDVAN